MSVANQANEKLSQLVTLTAKIESYLNPNKTGKDKGEKEDKKGKKDGESQKAQKVASPADISKEAAAISGMSTSLSKLITAVDKLNPEAANKLSTFLSAMSSGVIEAANLLKDGKENVKGFIDSVVSLLKAAGKWSLVMAAISLISPLVLLGSAVFSLSLRMVLSPIAKYADSFKENNTALDGLASISKVLPMFPLAMAGIALLAPLVLIGSAVFALSLRMILGAMAKTANSFKETNTALASLASLLKEVPRFILTMTGVALLSPLVLLGSAVFALSLRMLLSALAKYDKKTEESANTIISITSIIPKFALTMIGIALLSPVIALGVLVFTLSLKGILKVLADTSEKSKEIKESAEAFLAITKGAALFALTMVGIALVAPIFALGALVFTAVVGGMIYVLNKVATFKNSAKEGINYLLSLAKGAAIFALVMIGIGLVAPQFALGALVFTVVVAGMIYILSRVSTFKKTAKEGIDYLLSLAKGAALFALVMIGISLVAPQFALGALVFTVVVMGMIYLLSRVSTFKKTAKEGINYLLSLAKGAALFALVMVGIGLVAPLFALGALAFSLGILAVSAALLFVGKFKKEVDQGSKSIMKMILPIAGISVVLYLVGLGAQQIAIGALVAAGSIVVLGLATYLIGKLDNKKEITKGAGVLIILGVSLILFSVAMFILAKAPDTPLNLALKMAVIAGAIVVLGIAARIIGDPSISWMVAIGAGVLVLLALPLIIFAGALFILSKTNFEKEQAINLGYTIGVLGLATAALGLMSPFIVAGSIAMLPMSLALMALVPSLEKFKEIGWEESDAESLKTAMKSVVDAYVGAFTGIGPLDLIKLLATIPLIGMMGTSLASLAVGVKAMATMTFVETEYDEKTGKLIPKREVRLTNEDIQAVGPNVAAILNALAEPLTNFGKWAKEGTFTFGPFTLGSGYMEYGIDMAAKIGGFLVNLATGVAQMANLEVVEYEVVGKGTKDAKLVPKGSRKLNSADFILAGLNVNAILGAITKPLLAFGEASEKGDGWFSGGYLEKGIEASKKISDFLVNLATGVAQMATLEVVEYEVVGKGTKDAKLVPKGSRKLNSTDFKLAGEGVGSLLGALTIPLTKFGEAYEKGEGWFSNGYMQKGIDAIAQIGDPIAKLAKAVTDMAAGQATISEVVDGKVVPKSMISFADAIPKAKQQLSDLLNSLPKIFVDFGTWYDENEDAFDNGVDALDELQDVVSVVGGIAAEYVTVLTELEKAEPLKTKSIQPFLADLSSGAVLVGDSFSEGKFGSKQIKNYDHMVKVTERLAKIVSPFEKFVKSFGVFAKDMGVFTQNFEVFGKDNAENFKSIGEVVDKVSKVDVGKLNAALKSLNNYAKEEQQMFRERKASGLGSEDRTASAITRVADNAKIAAGSSMTQAPAGKQQQQQFPTTIANITVEKIVVTRNIEVSGDVNER